MHALRKFLKGKYTRVAIKLDKPGWHTQTGVPPEQGWYYIETDAPLEILARQALCDRQYTTKISGARADVKNYDLKKRCERFDAALAEYWNTRYVYSGYASNLQSRAREHTFADPGTGGLALSNYAELHDFDWCFCYRTLGEFMPDCPNPDMLLRLGEQIWRSENGWPILCER